MRCEDNLLWWSVNGTSLKETSSQSAWSVQSTFTHDSILLSIRFFFSRNYDSLLMYLCHHLSNIAWCFHLYIDYRRRKKKKTTRTTKEKKRSVASHISSFCYFSLFFTHTLVNLFFIGCAVRFIVPPIVTILIIHSVRRQERWCGVKERNRRRKRENASKRERERERKKEKREVLIRTLINLFCSDPEC